MKGFYDPRTLQDEAKKPLTHVSKPVIGAHAERGWQKGLAEMVGEGWAKDWHRVAKRWQRVGKVTLHPPTLQFPRHGEGLFQGTTYALQKFGGAPKERRRRRAEKTVVQNASSVASFHIFEEGFNMPQKNVQNGFVLGVPKLRADSREGDEDSNFSLFRVRQFTESLGLLH